MDKESSLYGGDIGPDEFDPLIFGAPYGLISTARLRVIVQHHIPLRVFP